MMITADNIQKRLMYHLRQQHAWVMPNVFIGGYERDCIMINKNSGLWNEYEIKVSIADFKKDFLKTTGSYSADMFSPKAQVKYFTTNKHEHFAKRNVTISTPNRFIFVTPAGLIDKESLPDYAGLITYHEHEVDLDRALGHHYHSGGYLQVVKSGKLLHKNKIADAIKLDILDKAYQRYHFQRPDLLEARKQNSELNQQLGYYYNLFDTIMKAPA